jgi:hypothetical protein
MPRSVHPNSDIEESVKLAEDSGWRYEYSAGHAWGRLFCPSGRRGGCIISVWSTPRDAFDHARQIRRRIGKCPH